MTLAVPKVLAGGQSFLSKHRATLVSDGSQWLLTYPIAAFEYGSRLEESVDVALPIAARSYDDALMIVEMILRDHIAPALPAPQLPLDSLPAPPTTGRHTPTLYGIIPPWGASAMTRSSTAG